jgi:hypothetical protein
MLAIASAKEINDELNAKFSRLQEGFAFSIMPPPILGLGRVPVIRCSAGPRGLGMASCRPR